MRHIPKSDESPIPITSPFQNSPSLTLRLEQRQDVIHPHRALDVPDDGSRRVVHEFDADLGDTSSRTGTAEHLTYQLTVLG